MMSGLYIIPLSGLKEGHRTYEFEIGKEFFDQFEGSEVKEGSLSAVVDLDKCSSQIDLKFTISGSVKISCDRCLEVFDYPLECQNRLLIRTGRQWEEDDPDMLTIPSDEHELDIRQYLYEYIHLALPLRRIHPDDENRVSGCNPRMLKKINELNAESDIHSDPRWDELKKLKNNN